MAGGSARLITLAFLATVTAGCGTSAPPRFYTLASTATSDSAPAVRASVMVGPVFIPATVDQPQMVVQVAANRVEMEEFSRWAAPLNDSIARAVAGDLAVLLGTPDVTSMPLANFNPAYRVTINVQRFESVKSQAALIDALWVVYRTAGGETRSGRTVAREATQGEGFEALASAHSRALAQMSADIAAAIRAEAAAKPSRPDALPGRGRTAATNK
jgi:uncharacterized protein